MATTSTSYDAILKDFYEVPVREHIENKVTILKLTEKSRYTSLVMRVLVLALKALLCQRQVARVMSIRTLRLNSSMVELH